MKITLFSGGRGNKNLITELSKLDKTTYDIRIIINGYDDGLSTGELRDYLGNILGPSDFRKCISYLGKNTDTVKLCDYRLPVGSTRSDFQKFTETVSNENLKNLLKYFDKFVGDSKFNYSDCAIGNIVFSSLFIQNNDFQETVDKYAIFLGVPDNFRIINVDKGVSRRLVALLSDGTYLQDESSIVNLDHKTKISDFFFIPYGERLSLPKDYRNNLVKLTALNVVPEVSDLAKSEIRNSDIVIFGSGTQYSSLLPTYKILGENNVTISAKSYMIGNVGFDHDILNLTHEEIIDTTLNCFKDQYNLISNIDNYLCVETENDLKFGKSLSDSYKGIRIVKNDKFMTSDNKTNASEILNFILKDN